MQPLEIVNRFNDIYEQVRHTHHITTSYAEHKALGKFYEEWADLTDDFIETYQGKYGRIEGSLSTMASSSVDIVVFLKEAELFTVQLFTELPAIDQGLKNLAADMQNLVNHTLYLLSLK